MELLRPVAGRARPSTATCTGSSARRSRSAAAAAGRPRGRATPAAPSRSPSRVTSTLGSVVHMRPLPSDSTHARPCRSRRRRSSRPTRRPAPTGTSRAGAGARPRRSPSPPSRGPARARSCARTAPGSPPGCGGSPARGCATSLSPRELDDQLGQVGLDRARSPRAASASLSPISSVASDLTLITSRAPCARAIRGHDRVRLGRRRAPSAPCPPARVTAASSRSSCSGSVAIARALIAAPASRSASQSGSSATARGALGADRRRRLAEVAPQLGVRQRLARGRREARHSRAPPGSRPGASRARRRAGAAARRRCASGTSCRPPCRPRRACRGRGAACRRASPSTCRRS